MASNHELVDLYNYCNMVCLKLHKTKKSAFARQSSVLRVPLENATCARTWRSKQTHTPAKINYTPRACSCTYCSKPMGKTRHTQTKVVSARHRAVVVRWRGKVCGAFLDLTRGRWQLWVFWLCWQMCHCDVSMLDWTHHQLPLNAFRAYCAMKINTSN